MHGGDAPAWLEVDLGAVRRNARRLADLAGCPLLAMVKGDAYGLGAARVARAIGAAFGAQRSTSHVWGLGVASLDEAAALRDDGCTARIVCTTPLLPSALGDCAALSVRPSLHDARDIATWGATGAPWHLSIDTGMNRAGIAWDRCAALRDALPHLPPEGAYTHYHSAGRDPESVARQDRRFDTAIASLGAPVEQALLHTDNSAAIGTHVGHRTPRALARPGIGIYGAAMDATLHLEQTVHVYSRIIDLHTVAAGESVSYDATFVAERDTTVATVALGYADGYRRALSGNGLAIAGDRVCPVIGRVTMDMTMIDVTGVACARGDVVTMLGRPLASGDAPPKSIPRSRTVLDTDAVAAAGGLSPYELLAGLALRLPRVYRGEE